MIRSYLQAILAWLRRAVTQPRDELDRWERATRYAHDLGVYGARQLRRDRAPQMAGALAFRTLFGLLPVLVMGAVVLRAMRGPENFIELLEGLIDAAGVEVANSEVGAMLAEVVFQAAYYDASTIGWIGLLVLTYSALSLMVTIENSFNIVFRAPEGRSWTKRLPMYWFVLTLGPVAVGASFYLNNKAASWINSVEALGWLFQLGTVAWTFVVTWLFLLAVYVLVPNTSIKLRPAAMGALVAAVLLSLGKHLLGAYLANAVSVTQFGGSLGLIPLFMLWVYLMWLVVLFGLEVGATLQMLAGRALTEIEPRPDHTGLVDPASILVVMEIVGERFQQAQSTTASKIAGRSGIPEATVLIMLDRLVEERVLHRLEEGEGAFVLARPPERIDAKELIELGFSLVDDGGQIADRPPLVQKLREAQRALAAGAALTELLPPKPVGDSGGQVSAR